MYSRNRVTTAEQRYAENLPPVYGGSRFYRGTPAASAAVKESAPPRQTEPVVTPASGIPVEYAVRPGGGTDVPVWEETFSEAAEPVPVPEDAVPAARAAEPVREESGTPPGKAAREGGIASLLMGDSEEILLIVLILLLGGEAERAADVIVILLLLLVVR